MIRALFLVVLSLVAVATGCVFAYLVWVATPIFDPLWRASFAVLSWIFGFALGTRGFWATVMRVQRGGSAL